MFEEVSYWVMLLKCFGGVELIEILVIVEIMFKYLILVLFIIEIYVDNYCVDGFSLYNKLGYCYRL